MKKILFIAGFTLLTITINAQATVLDSVEMGSGYANEVYYRLIDGEKLAKQATEWHIAFHTSANSATIISNAALGLKIAKYPGTNADFETADTTGFESWTKLYDDSLDFFNGAFTRMATGHPDYGWGTYSNATHVVNGNSIFFIKTADETYKIDFIKKQTGTITFRYAKINESTGTEIVVAASTTYANKDFVFFNLETGQVLDRELEGWDLWAVKYIDWYNGTAPDQAVTGILANPKWEVAVVNVGSGNQASHSDYTLGNFEQKKNAIGQSYKFMNASYQWEVTTDKVYYLQNEDGDIWKWYPTNFVGTSAGKTVFIKQQMAFAGVETLETQFVDVYPNPTQGQLTVVFDSKAANAEILVKNQLGQLISSRTIPTTSGVNQAKLDISTATNGMYFVEVIQNNTTTVKSVVKF